MKNVLLIVLVLALALTWVALLDQKGPLDQAAEEMNEAVQDLRSGEKTLGHRLDDSIDEIRAGAKDLRKDLEKSLEGR